MSSFSHYLTGYLHTSFVFMVLYVEKILDLTVHTCSSGTGIRLGRLKKTDFSMIKEYLAVRVFCQWNKLPVENESTDMIELDPGREENHLGIL